mgnify:CR=1 FL=1
MGIGTRVAYNDVKVRPPPPSLPPSLIFFLRALSLMHAPPCGSFLSSCAQLEPHQILSNEPGYYHDGEFGIRIENLVCVVPAKTEHSFGGVKYLAMEHLTMVRSASPSSASRRAPRPG